MTLLYLNSGIYIMQNTMVGEGGMVAAGEKNEKLRGGKREENVIKKGKRGLKMYLFGL